MSDIVGPIRYGENEETLFLGREVTRSRDHSEATARRIDDEVRRIVDQCYQETEELIEDNRVGVERIAQALMERETLTGEEVARVVKGEPLELEIGKNEGSDAGQEETSKSPETEESPGTVASGKRAAGEVAVAEASAEGTQGAAGEISSSG